MWSLGFQRKVLVFDQRAKRCRSGPDGRVHLTYRSGAGKRRGFATSFQVRTSIKAVSISPVDFSAKMATKNLTVALNLRKCWS